MRTQSLQHQNEVIVKYKKGESVLSLSKKYECSTYSIQKILDNNDVSKVTQAKRNNPFLIEDYFENIDSKEKAYWLGWLLTDGCVTKRNSIELTVRQDDEYILKLLEQDLGVSGCVKAFGKNYSRFVLGSKKMCNDLSKFGVVPNKSLTLKFPNNIPKKYETHLLRGMFDGDGGFTLGMTTRYYKHRKKTYTKPYQELSFTNIYSICDEFQTTLLKYVDIGKKNITSNNSIYRVRWSNREEILHILEILYTDCGNHYLKRKCSLYKQLRGLVA